ncbi:MAG: hypothetical protein KAV00_10535 [Phycisphaerae bacterium]|nr:hypothetical protein [Phycisphaerae bacterium]
MGEYRFYRGVGSADAIDWTTVVGTAPAGTGTKDLVGLGHTPDVEYFYGIRAVSDSAVEEENTDRIVRVMVDSLGNLIGPPPNAVHSARAYAVAGGKIEIEITYVSRGQHGVASAVQIAEITGGVPDWVSPLAEVSVGSKTSHKTAKPAKVFEHDTTIRLAVRAITAAGASGPVKRLSPVVADSEAPAAVDYVEVEQI